MEATVENIDVFHAADLLQVTDAAPDNGAAPLGSLADHRCQIAAHQSAVLCLVEQVRHKNVIFHQIVHDPLVIHTLHTLGLALAHHGDFQILPNGNESSGNGTANCRLVSVMGALEFTLELVIVQLHPGKTPDFFDAHAAQTFQNTVRHLGAAVLKAFAGPEGCHLNDVFSIVELHNVTSFYILFTQIIR